MEKEPTEKIKEKIIDGKKYRKIDTGFTVRQFYSQSTPEKGPGPGWDTRWKMLQKYGVNDPSELPDEPYYTWEEIE